MSGVIDLLKKPQAGRVVFLLSALVAVYFGALRLIHYLNVDHVLVGVFVEMFTIPMLLMVVLLISASIILIIKKGISFLSFHLYSLVILAAVIFLLLNSL